MSGKSGIEWTEATWNPVVGCKRVSSGCDHCYAFELHDKRHIAWKRGRWASAPAQYHKPFSTVQLLPDRLDDPLHWRKPRRVFVNSMSDLFHEDVPDEFIEQVFGVMTLTPQHTYQILTKRPERMRDWICTHTHEEVAAAVTAWGPGFTPPAVGKRTSRRIGEQICAGWPWPLPNVWLGVSVENQQAADERIPLLLQTPAKVRFLSMEPLMERVNIDEWLGLEAVEAYEPWEPMTYERVAPSQLDWVIVGGESGKHARTFYWEWCPIEECRAASVPIFVKQLGTAWAKKHNAHDQHGGDMSEWPAHLRVREFPQTAGSEVLA